MARRKKSKSKSGRRSNFFKPLLILAAASLLIWLWQGKRAPEPKKTPKRAASEASSVETKTPAELKVESEPPPETVEALKLTGVFPKEAWLDDYLQVPAALQGDKKKDFLVGLGLAPQGKDPEKILNPDQLRPELLVVEKSDGRFVRREAFDFSTQEPTEAGIRKEDLRGIPRVTRQDFIELTGDGAPEIKVKLDTHGTWTEAIALLQWKDGRLEWLKTLDPKSGTKKIALWLVGSTSTETQEIVLEDTDGDGRKEIIARYGRLDPKKPEKGFVWDTTVWKWREGALVKEIGDRR